MQEKVTLPVVVLPIESRGIMKLSNAVVWLSLLIVALALVADALK